MADVMNEIMTNDKTKILSGEFLNFYTPRRQRIRSFKVYFSPKQEGSGTPSPENVRPISGWTGVEVQHCGKNLLNESEWSKISYLTYENGIFSTTQKVPFSYIYFLRTFKNGTRIQNLRFSKNTELDRYVCSVPIVLGDIDTIQLGFLNTDNNHYLNYNASKIFPTDGNYFVSFKLNQAYTSSQVGKMSELQIELGTQPTEYTPYKTNLSLPKEYQEVEYIKSTGTQWIDTGIIPTANTISKIKFINHERTGNVIYGHQQDAHDQHDYRMFITGNDTIYLDIISGRINKQAPSSMALGIVCELELGNFYIKDLSNNEIIQSTNPVPQSEFVYDYTITLNNYRNGIFSKNSWYYVKIYDNDTIVRNFIPCYRKSDKVAGMYDAVSGQFYTNSGTGEFILGPAVNRYDIDWSEDVGTVYGGYVDLVSGELVETYGKIQLTGDENLGINPWNHNGVYWQVRETSYDTAKIPFMNGQSYGNMLPYDNHGYYIRTDGSFSIVGGGYVPNYTYLTLYNSNWGTTPEEYKAALKKLHDNGTPLTIVAPLKTPYHQTHQLSPSTISTLIRNNNFWTNADRIEIEYDYIGVFDAITSRKNIFTATPHTVTAKDSIISFGTDMAADLKECKVWFLPKQLGEGNPSPENVRPIEGWDGITVIYSGKNLLPNISYTNFWTTGWLNTSGGITPSNNPYITSDFMRVRSGDNYILQLYNDYDGGISNAWKCIGFYDKNKSFLTGQYYEKGGRNALTVSVPANANYMRVSFTNQNRKGFPDSHFQLEFGTEVTDYESYQSPTEITIPFPQTIYGGYVDLVKGEIVEEWNHVKGEDLDWNKSIGNYSTFVSATNNNGKGHGPEPHNQNFVISSHYRSENWNSASTNGDNYVWIYTNGTIRLKDTSKKDFTVSEFIEYITDQDFCYVLETPNTYPLTPHTLTTIRGANTIWSNSNDDTEVTYYTHGDDAYQHVPSSPITSNDNFIIVTDDGYAIGEEDDFIVY